MIMLELCEGEAKYAEGGGETRFAPPLVAPLVVGKYRIFFLKALPQCPPKELIFWQKTRIFFYDFSATNL